MNNELIHVAWQIIAVDADDTSSARSRKAISAAYYALFHALARSNADVLVGTGESDASWCRVYRALDHGMAKRVLSPLKTPIMPLSPLTIFAAAFVELQEKRHLADYDPSAVFTLEGASLLVLQATQANQQFNFVEPRIRRDLATELLFKSRS